MSLRSHLVQLATIEKETYAVDSYGEQTATTTIEAAGLPCLVRPMNAEMKAEQGRDASRIMARIYFDERPFPIDEGRERLIRVDDRVWRPVEALDVNSMGRLWQVDCELVTG